MNKNHRYWDDLLGWGTIIAKNKTFIVVRFDSDPWICRRIPKEEKKNDSV